MDVFGTSLVSLVFVIVIISQKREKKKTITRVFI